MEKVNAPSGEDQCESAAEAGTDDRWRRADMRAWAREANAMGVKVPIPE